MFKKLNLLSRTEMKLLKFISERDHELYERQIAKEAGVSVGSANAILRSFARLGLVKVLRKGRMAFYRRNDDNPLLRQFKVFVTVNELSEITSRLAPISKRIVLFGSCAVGRNGEGSDIDLFVLSSEKETARRLLDAFPKVQAILLNSVEYASLRQKDKPLYARISSGIELHGETNG